MRCAQSADLYISPHLLAACCRRFRGSRPGVLSRIGSWWRCRTLVLPTNYRSGGVIVATARALIEASNLREVKTPLLSSGPLATAGTVRVLAHATRHEEDEHLIAELRALQQAALADSSRWPAGGCAILCRTRAQVVEIAHALKAASIKMVCREDGRKSGEALQQRARDVLSCARRT